MKGWSKRILRLKNEKGNFHTVLILSLLHMLNSEDILPEPRDTVEVWFFASEWSQDWKDTSDSTQFLASRPVEVSQTHK